MSSTPPEGAGILKMDLTLKPVFMGFLIGTAYLFAGTPIFGHRRPQRYWQNYKRREKLLRR
jgi:hypothetical protein